MFDLQKKNTRILVANSTTRMPLALWSLQGASLCLILFLILAIPSLSFAVARYAPGETLNPDCGPTETDCTVSAPALAGANSDITSLSGLINITSSGLTISSLLTLLGNLGIGTTSPYAKLAVVGPVVAEYFYATSTMATSTFAGNIVINGIGTSTIENNLQVKGNLKIGTNSLTINDSAMTAAGGSFSIGTSNSEENLSLQSYGRVGISSSTPWGVLSVEHNGANADMPIFVVSQIGTSSPFLLVDHMGKVGIGTSSPADTLSVNGPIYLENVSPASTQNRLYANSGNLYWAGNLIGGSTGNWTTDGTNAWRVTGNIGIGTTSPLAKLHVGNGTTNNSVDSQILVSRLADDTVLGNGHAFSDSSIITRAGTIGYNSFDGRITISGTNNYDHYVAFQAAPVYSSSGTIGTLEGATWAPTITTGAITNLVGYKVNDINISGGTVLNQYGFYVPNTLTAATNNWAFYSGGTTKSYFGGSVGIGYTDPGTAKLAINGNVGIGTITPDSWGRLTITQSSDTNTGGLAVVNSGTLSARLYVDANGIRHLTAGTTDVINWNATGNVGIGTTSPSAKLSITGTGQTTGRAFVISDSANVERLTVLDNGNVGVGTANPGAKLDIKMAVGVSGISLTGYNSSSITHLMWENGNDNGAFALYAGGVDKIHFTAKANENSYFNNGGNVGIGTTTPSYLLDINGSGVTNGGILRLKNYVAGAIGPRLILDNSAGVGQGVIDFYTINNANPSTEGPSARWHVVDDANYSANMFFESNTPGVTHPPSTGMPVRLAIMSSGNIGIGTTSPYAKLSVVGSVVAEYFHATSTMATSTFAGGMNVHNLLYVDSNSNNVGVGTTNPREKLDVNGSIRMQGNGNSMYFADATPTSHWHIGLANSNADLNFSESAVADGRLYLKAGGNVGIGTTNPGTKLDIVGNFSNYNNGTNLATGDSSTFTSGIGAWTYWYGSGTLTANGGKGVFDNLGNNYYLNVMSIGTTYTLSLKARVVSGAGSTITLSSGASGTISGITGTEQTFTTTFVATGSAFGLTTPVGTSIEIDDVSLVGPTSAKWVFPGQTVGAWQSSRGNLVVDNGIVIGPSDVATSTAMLTVYGLGNKTLGLLDVQTTSSSGRGTLAKIGEYSFWNMDGGGSTYWSWGTRFDGVTNAWVRSYTADNNWLPYTKYDVNGKMIWGGAATNDKTNLVPVMTDRVVFDMSTGNVGVGSTTPSAKLSITGTGQTTGRAFVIADSANVERMTVLDNGNVGVGTAVPEAPLHISKTHQDGVRELLVKAKVDDANSFFFINNGTVSNGAFAPVFAGYTDSTTLWPMGFAGFVTSTNDDSDSSNYGLLDFAVMRTTDTASPLNGTLSDIVNRKILSIRGSTNSKPYLYILANGNVGIGTSAPVGKLDVRGADYPVLHIQRDKVSGSGLIYGTAELELTNTTPTAGNGTGFYFKAPDSAGNSTYTGVFGGALSTITNGSEIGDIQFGTSWQGADPSANINLIIRATGATTGNVLIQNGNVGIGTTSPYAKLSIATAPGADGSQSTLFNIASSTATATTSLFTVLNNGNVGIGTETPSNILDVRGSNPMINVKDSSYADTVKIGVVSGYAGLWLGQTTPSVTNWAFMSTGFGNGFNTPSGDLRFRINNADKVTISNAGNLGIGTTSPYAKFSIQNGGLSIDTYNPTLFAIASSTNGTATTTAFTVLANGNVGVGMAAPIYKLDVAGSFRAGLTNRFTIVPDYTANGDLVAGVFFGSNGTGGINIIPNDDGVAGTKVVIASYMTGGWKSMIETANTASSIAPNLLLAKTVGNVGIGTTSPYAKLSVVGPVVAEYFHATSTTATSTFAGGFTVGSSAVPRFIVDSSSGNIGINSVVTSARLTVKDTNSYVYGVDKVTNGNFDGSADGWTLGNGWAYHSYDLKFTAGGTGLLEQNIGAVAKECYRVTIDGYSTGLSIFQFSIGDASSYLTLNGSGMILSNTLCPLVPGNFTMTPISNPADADISSIVVKKQTLSNTNPTISILNGNGAVGLELRSGSLSSANSFVGYNAGVNNIAGYSNSFFGYQAGNTNISGHSNVAVGNYSLYNNISGYNNVANGTFSLYSNISGSNNNTSGVYSLYNNRTGSNNSAYGNNALRYASTTSGVTAIGMQAGVGPSVGSDVYGTPLIVSDYNSWNDTNMTFIGYASSRDSSIASTTSLTNSTAIGYNAHVGGSNMMVLGGTGADSVKVGIGTTSPYAKLSIHANNGETNSTLLSIASSTVTATTSLFTVLNNGNVGIGVTEPGAKLEVDGNIVISANNWLQFDGGSGNHRNVLTMSGSNVVTLNAMITNPIRFTIDDTEKARVDASGNFGIGTTSPYAKLSVAGETVSSYYTATTTTATSTFAGGMNVAGTTGLTVLQNGNVGISTITPGVSLDVAGYIRTNFGVKANWLDTTTSGSGHTILTMTGGGNNYGVMQVNSGSPSAWALGYSNEASAGLGTQVLTWNENGKVGIGTTTPWAQLSVNPNGITGPAFAIGSSTATNFVVTNGGSVGIGTVSPEASLDVRRVGGNENLFQIKNSAGNTAFIMDNSQLQAQFYSDGGVTHPSITFIGDIDTGIDHLGIANTIGFITGNTERVRINSSGNVGIGTTSPYAKLSVAGSGTGTGTAFAVSDVSSTTRMVVLDNGNVGIGTASPNDALHIITTDGSGSLTLSGKVAQTTQYAQLYFTNNGDNSLDVKTGYGNGTGNVITFSPGGSEKVRFQQNGNVGISTTSPWRTLSVVGTMGIQGLTSSAVGNALCITANNEVTTASVAACAGVSSQRFKHDILDTDLGLSTILNLRPVSFKYNEGYGDSGKDQQFGLIAEEVQKIDHRLIIFDSGGLPTAVRYDFLPTILVKAVQELSAKVNDLVSNGLANLKEIVVDLLIAKKVQTAELCVDDVCINKAQLKTLLQTANISSVIPAQEGIQSATSSPTPPSPEASEGQSTPAVGTSTPPHTGGVGDVSFGSLTPKITLLGNNPAEITLGSTFIDPGAIALDSIGTDLMPDIIENTVNTSVVGEYKVVWEAHDSLMNIATSTRIVIVIAPQTSVSSSTPVTDVGTTTPAE